MLFGAAREVTGSCHILRLGGRTVLLDCGMFPGRRQESREKNLRLPIPAERIDAVVLSHAHIRDPQPPNGAAAVIKESTYSDRDPVVIIAASGMAELGRILTIC